MARRLALLKLIVNHPINRKRRAQAIGRWAGWQLWRFMIRRPITVRVWPGVRARVYPDWPYSWTAIYLRLAEYDDMMFALSYLRPGDVFVDVGANVGFYSLLASSVNGGSPVLALEPHPLASQRLRENASLNSFGNIRIRAVAAGRAAGSAQLTMNLADENRIKAEENDSGPSITVPVVTLDAELASQGISAADVRLVKVDTEGFEASVLSGAQSLLGDKPGPVWLVELLGFGHRYGSDDTEIHDMFSRHGYRAFRYEAGSNRLVDFDGPGSDRGNVIFAREREPVEARLNRAKPS
jgi:FkbM family methyltransferase